MCLPVATLTWTSIAEKSILQADEELMQHFKSSHGSRPSELQPWITKRPHHSLVAEFGDSMAICIRQLNACQTNFNAPTKNSIWVFDYCERVCIELGGDIDEIPPPQQRQKPSPSTGNNVDETCDDVWMIIHLLDGCTKTKTTLDIVFGVIWYFTSLW